MIQPELMAAALQILSESGPEGFTIRAIARRAEVAPMAIYNHFDGKDGLLEAIWIEGFTMLRRELEVTSINPNNKLFDTAHAYRRFALTHRSHYTVMFMHRFIGFTPSASAAAVALETFQTLVRLVKSAQSVGIFSDYDTVDAAQMLWSTCHGFVSLEMLDINFAADRDETFIDFVRGVERGIANSHE
jgi:AcrR family transcriptional regulator